MTETQTAQTLINKANELLDKADRILDHKDRDPKSITTEIVVVLDRSGSMAGIADDMEGGFKAFIDEQKWVAGDAKVTLVQFDTEYETVYKRRSLTDAPLTLLPRGGTALLDAMGRTICTMLDEIPRENLVVFVVITDGQENSSREFRLDDVRKLTKRCERERDWQFVFLGANQEAFAEASQVGVNFNNAVRFSANRVGVQNAMRMTSQKIANYRGAGGQSVGSLNYTEEDRINADADWKPGP